MANTARKNFTMKHQNPNPLTTEPRWSANKRSCTFDLRPGMTLDSVLTEAQKAADDMYLQRMDRLAAAVGLACTLNCGELMMALLAKSIQRDDGLDEMSRALGLRYGQVKLLVQGAHSVARRAPEFYRACAAYLGCNTLSIEVLAGSKSREDYMAPESNDDSHWQSTRLAADAVVLRAMQTLADAIQRLPSPKAANPPEWLRRAG